MTDATTVASLLSWCAERGFWVDPRIQVISGVFGAAVTSRETTIPTDTVLVRIPRSSVLSVKSSSVSDLIPPHPYGRGAQLSLALALSVELLIGSRSPWAPYLNSLPQEIPGIPLFWHGGANQPGPPQSGSPLEWLHGTEASKMLFGLGDSGSSLVSEIDEYFHRVAHPVYSKYSPETILSLCEFYHAYSLVSSRAFLVDSYHGLSMVPIADAFNHAQDNHVHLESDFDVCPECGSLHRCVHDDTGDPVARSTIPDNADDFYEMVSNLAIPPNSEVFNTYGETLSNAELLVQYGFILDDSDNDHLTWTFDELAEFTEHNLSASSSWTWDTVGGRARFEALLRSISSLPWSRISESELVHLDRSRPFCLNGDATISHDLWLYFALLLIIRNRPDHSRNSVAILLLQEMFQSQLTFEQHLASGEDRFVPTLHGDGRPPAPYVLILELARLLASLCRARFAQTGRAGVEMTELGDILDRLPNEMSPTRMAVSLVLTERSLLDSCMSAWEGIADALG
ncbi:hypothetical protein DFH06DRAFT_1321698 [Mycena polygramma]|nr:hypothetical protein DFH06DRAFT_1321698 [Mycena polygramma]